ncbi:MAG: hypothetical protein U9M89_01025 [Patescibacteria group bacterium]|nr:hypothetical protein [Patescibacteria group bacterium]
MLIVILAIIIWLISLGCWWEMEEYSIDTREEENQNNSDRKSDRKEVR